MGTIILLFIATVGVFLVLSVILIEYLNKNDCWTGIVEDKKIIYYKYRDREKTHYLLVFRNNLGKRIKCTVNQYQYNSFNIGDEVKKVKESYLPFLICDNYEDESNANPDGNATP